MSKILKDSQKKGAIELLNQGVKFEVIQQIIGESMMGMSDIKLDIQQSLLEKLEHNESLNPLMLINILKVSDEGTARDIFSNEKLFEELLESVDGQFDDELRCKVSFDLMNEPVLLSSGLVLDKSSVLDKNNYLRYTRCPFTK